MKIIYGFSLVIVILAGCFGFLTYEIIQLQSQVTTLQQQNTNASQPKIIILAYSWTDSVYAGSMHRISVNCTLLNASPENATMVGVDIKAQFGAHIETTAWSVEDMMAPWQTKNEYDLGLIYDKTALGNLDTVWLELNWG